MDVIVPILIQVVAGGAGGNVIAQLLKSTDLGLVGNSIVGAVGGVAATGLAGLVPGLDALVGATGAIGGLDLGALAGQGATALAGGGLLTLIVGMAKSAMAKS